MTWISVKDRLPEKTNRSYLVYIIFYPKDLVSFSGIVEATLRKENEEFKWFCGLCNLTWTHECEITHWMHLPDPPKEEK